MRRRTEIAMTATCYAAAFTEGEMATSVHVGAPSLEQLKPQFQPALLEFLLNLRKQQHAPTVNSIYGNYNQSVMVATTDLDEGVANKTIATLFKGMADIKAPRILLEYVQGEPPKDINFAAGPAAWLSQFEGDFEESPFLWGAYWFERDGAITAEHRVYVHIREPLAETGPEVLKVLVPKIYDTPGFQKVKLFGPRQGKGRNDSIVAYCSTKEAQKALADVLKTVKADLLLDDIPRWLKKVCPGVGIADNPPQTEVLLQEGTTQSFGKFLSKLIYLAWTHNKLNTDEEFLRLVLKAFEVAKMDARKPHRHSRRAEVEQMQPGLNLALLKALSE